MRCNYHTHTARCGHAEGRDEEYVRAAIDAGFDLLGFADHAPYAGHPEDYPDPAKAFGIRMPPEALPDYAESFRRLRAEYGGQIELRLGVEAEYYPDYFEALRRDLRANGVEYMILGQHFLGNGLHEAYSGRPPVDPRELDRYVDQCIEAMDTGCFSYFAHPDLYRFPGEDADYLRAMRRLCVAAREHALPLEYNLLGLREGRNYPDPRFWRLAAEEGCVAVLGWDAHAPWALKVPEAEQSALETLERLGLRRLERVELKAI